MGLSMSALEDRFAELEREMTGEAERLTDLGNARRLVQKHGRDLIHCRSHKCWYIWDGTRWRRDETGEIYRRAKDTARAIWEEAATASDQTTRKDLGKHAAASEAEPRMRAMVAMAETEPEIAVSPSMLDANPDLLNCLNGTLDLATVTLNAHEPRDLITKLAPVQFDPMACSVWWEFMLRRQIPDPEVRAFLARLAGYSLSGRPEADVVPFIHGPEAAGKTTYTEALRRTLGDYARVADFRTFLRGRGRDGASHTEDLVRLEGARLVVAAEVQEGAALDEGTLKKLSGGESYLARGLHQSSREIAPQFVVYLVSNDRPKVRDDDAATWRRLVTVPFDRTVPEKKRRPHLRARLVNPEVCGSAVLAWAVRGLEDYRHGGLRAPDAVRNATAAYKDSMNPLKQGWLEECCETDEEYSEEFSRLWASWRAWAEDNLKQRDHLTKHEFTDRLTKLGFEAKVNSRVAIRFGVRLRNQA